MRAQTKPSAVAKWDRSKGRPEPIHLLNRVRELENHEPLVDLIEVCPRLRILRPAVIPYLRATVAEMVNQAIDRLPEGIHLGVVDAWRPYNRQQRIFDFVWKCAVQEFPDRSYSQLRRTVCRFVAPTDQKAPPGHCTGAAIDVWLVNDDNEQLDVNSPYERWQAAPTFVYGLSEEARKNRILLHSVMTEAGFSNCRDEYWHYSFGDAGWAVRNGLHECQYGLISLDEALYKAQEDAWLEDLPKRTNPFSSTLPA